MDFERVKLEDLKSVGKKTAQYLNKLNIYNLSDLLNFCPKKYEFWDFVTNLELIEPEKTFCVKIKIISSYKSIKTSLGKNIYKLQGQDFNNNILDIVFFNSKFAAQSLIFNKIYLIRGKFRKINYNIYEIVSPKTQEFSENSQNNITPVYSQNSNISSNKISKIIKTQLEIFKDKITETLPETVRVNNNLCSRDFCIRNIHNPSNKSDLQIARKRLVFEEFFVYYLRIESIIYVA